MPTPSGEAGRPARAALAVALAALLHWPALAAEPAAIPREAAVGGVAVPLRGVGVSTKYTVEVCRVALYAPTQLADADDIVRSGGPRRILFQMLRDVSGEDFKQGLLDMSRSSGRAATPARVRGNLKLLAEAVAGRVGKLSRGDTVAIDWVPGAGVTVSRNMQALAPSVPDPDLFQVLAELWIGADSSDAELRRRLLGLAGPATQLGALSLNRQGANP